MIYFVTNGTFDTDSDWTLGTGWSIEDGVATSTTSGGSSYLTQSGILTSSNTYQITFTVSNYVSGTVKATVSGQEGSSITANGTYTEYLTTTGTNFSIKSQGGTFNGSVDNVSLVDVSSDFDFDRASSATRINSSGLVQDMQSITDPELVLNGDFEELGDEEITNGSFDTSIVIGLAFRLEKNNK